MKRGDRSAASVSVSEPPSKQGNNGHSTAAAAVVEPNAADLSVILSSLQTMRDGDFSVRLPGSWTGLAGKDRRYL